MGNLCYIEWLLYWSKYISSIDLLKKGWIHFVRLISSSLAFPVTYRVHFKLLLVVYKSPNNQSPQYIQEYLQPHSISGHDLRSCDQGLLKIPRTNFKTFGDRAFARSEPVLWNKLLLEIRNSQSVAIFKSKLKHICSS